MAIVKDKKETIAEYSLKKLNLKIFIDEILKISENFNKLGKLLHFSGSENMLAALEYEQRTENKLKK